MDLTQAPFKLLPLCWAGACETVSMPFKYGVSISCRVKPLFPIALQFSCAQTLLAFKARCSRRLICPVQDPWAGEPSVGAWKPSSSGRTFVIVIILLFVGYRSVGLDCIMSLPFLPILWFLLYVFSCGKPFLLVFRGLSQMVVSSSKTGVPLGSELCVFILWHLGHTTK